MVHRRCRAEGGASLSPSEMKKKGKKGDILLLRHVTVKPHHPSKDYFAATREVRGGRNDGVGVRAAAQ